MRRRTTGCARSSVSRESQPGLDDARPVASRHRVAFLLTSHDREGYMREADYQASVDPAGNATFGPGLVFEGKLSFKGQVEFNGTFKGAITTDDLLIIGEQAKVDAHIRCGSVVIRGEVTGKIKARDSVELRGHARGKAAIAPISLVTVKGGGFEA